MCRVVVMKKQWSPRATKVCNNSCFFHFFTSLFVFKIVKSDKEISSSNASMVKQDSIEQAPVAAAVSPIIRNTTHCTSTTVTKPQSGHDGLCT